MCGLVQFRFRGFRATQFVVDEWCWQTSVSRYHLFKLIYIRPILNLSPLNLVLIILPISYVWCHIRLSSANSY
jgi:hypothetical protein